MKRKYLHQSQHPFDAHPFEALRDGSWHSVEFIEIRDGIMTINFTDSQELIVKNGPYPNIRVKSRKATSSDCTCILRPGVDVCVLSSPQLTEGSQEENAEPEWVDARVSSIERKPHDSQCSCKFFVNLYIEQGPLGSEKARLSKDTEELGIDRISILQKLDNNPCEGRSYRWRYSEDCSSVQRSKLFWVKFSSDLTWLLVTSVLKQFTFDIRSVQNKIVYQILGIDDDDSSVKSYQQPRSISFKVDNGILIPIVVQCDADDSSEAASPCSMHGAEISPVHDVSNLRRSKRRNVQPERFLACDIPPEMDVGWVRTMPYKTEKWKDEDMDLPLSYFLLARASGFQHETEGETEIHFPKPDPFEDLPDSITKTKPREVDSSIAKANREARKSQLAIVPVCSGSNPIACERLNSPVKAPVNYSRKINGICSYYRRKGYSAARKKDNFELEDMVLESGWGGKASFSRVQAMRHRSIRPNKDDSCETVIRRKRTLSAGAYNKLINSYMKNIDSTIKSRGEEPHIMDQWEAFKSKGRTGNRVKLMEPLATEDEEEDSETEMLWREMEICMASAYLLEENEARVSTHKMSESSEYCQHEFKLDEEIGILCRICGFVRSEIKYVSAPFVENTSWNAEHKPWNDKNSEPMPDEYEDLNLFSSLASSAGMPLSEENNNVWALIPELRNKLHMHQKKAFEFLWRNIAGSMVPARMEKASKKIGGCVVSHTPGAGKTFLIIAFLVSYLKLFPGRRPLVLAPKTTLYTWYKEFIKWQIPVPVHLIHGRRTYSAFRQKSSVVTFRGDLKPSLDVMHVLDCLEKIQKWHAQPSVLVMGYTSFLTLMREDAKFAHRKYMAKVLRESPGILVLDEGHNPRSTKSRLRKVLMKVETDLRVLLSGTLFQNNFCEYFNTLCLARPKFIREVLRRLDPKFNRKKKGKEKARHLLESRARKLFLDNIAKKVDSSNLEEQKQGLKMLRKMTNRFIDVYESGSSDGLPGLQIYTILMNSTDIQHDVLTKIHKIMATYPGFPLELELLITLASIHPWLITTSNCVNKFFSSRELRELEKLQFECRKGSKVMFVLNLVYRVVRKEKVLIFCHNIAPINLFLGLFEKVFRWQKGREILVLTGDLELFERGRVMDKFEEPGSPSRVLLASITACAEGISLTAASRVIMMDSEWNPSKTRQAIARAFRPGQQKVVYVYQLLATRTLEEDKYRRTTWKEWVSSMIFSEAFVEDPSRWQAEKIEDDVLREIVGEDRVKSFHMIMKNEKASRVNNGLTNSGLTELHSDNK